jgi:hypothetical protein
MSADLTTALGSLLADRALRDALRRDRSEAARRLRVSEADLDGIDPELLELQAESLIDKRRHEVSKRLPQTMALLAARGPELFREYAGSTWPEGHRRHGVDAARFGGYLAERGLPLCRSEWNRAKFHIGTAWMSIRYARDAWAGGRSRRALELFFRVGGTVRSWALYLGV